MAQDVASIERRHGDQIKYRKQHVDLEKSISEYAYRNKSRVRSQAAHSCKGVHYVAPASGAQLQSQQNDCRSNCHNKIADWPYYRGQNVIQYGISEILRIDR